MKRRLFGIPVVVGGKEEYIRRVREEREALRGRYITFANVHAMMMSRRDAAYRQAQREAAYVMPDGKPVAWLLRRRGYPEAEQIAGPDFMQGLLEAEPGARHYFYGSTEETLERLREALTARYPELTIAGMVSPPFRELSAEEESEALRQMEEAGADYIWIGLGAPKQELYMQRMQGRVSGVMLGVGAAFDFLAGTAKRAPEHVRRAGLEWLYRLAGDPRRLWRRYLVTNTRFVLTVPFYLLHHKLCVGAKGRKGKTG